MKTANGIFTRVPYASSGGDDFRRPSRRLKQKDMVKVVYKSGEIYDPTQKDISLFAAILAKAKAYVHFKKIKDAVSEVKEIRAGKVKAQTLDDFLNEL